MTELPPLSREFTPNPLVRRLYPESAVGGYSHVDGQVELYTRVNALVDADSRVLDLGAGRGHWAVDPMPETARRLRWLRGRVAEVVGCDVDDAVLDNPALDRAVVQEAGTTLPFDDAEFDVVIADYVLEHVDHADAPGFADDVLRVLRPGGWFVARTPNKWGFIGVGARLVPNSLHARLVRRLQPGRHEVDVFPTRYAMNTRRRLAELFEGHEVVVYGHASEPAYFGRSILAWRLARLLGRFRPAALDPTLMIFVRKA